MTKFGDKLHEYNNYNINNILRKQKFKTENIIQRSIIFIRNFMTIERSKSVFNNLAIEMKSTLKKQMNKKTTRLINIRAYHKI